MEVESREIADQRQRVIQMPNGPDREAAAKRLEEMIEQAKRERS